MPMSVYVVLRPLISYYANYHIYLTVIQFFLDSGGFKQRILCSVTFLQKLAI